MYNLKENSISLIFSFIHNFNLRSSESFLWILTTFPSFITHCLFYLIHHITNVPSGAGCRNIDIVCIISDFLDELLWCLADVHCLLSTCEKWDTGKIPCSLFAKGAMLFLLYFCAQKTSQSESPHRDCSSRIQRHTMAKTKVGKKQGAELCTVNIFFKNNTRTKMFLLNQILFLVKYNKINSIK